MPGKYQALVLSRGEQYQPPPIRPREVGASSWPTDATVETVFYDSAGGVINTVAGLVAADALTWDTDPSEVDIVPAGAQYETFLTTVDTKKHQIRYGSVIRKQASFFAAQAAQAAAAVLQYSDNFYSRTGLVGSRWLALSGKPTIFDNPTPAPNGVGPKTSFFGPGAAMRYYAQLNTDNFVLSFNLLNLGHGKTGVFGACNSSGTSYIYVMFDSTANKAHMGLGTSPLALNDQVTAVDHTVPGSNAVTNYKLRYDDATKTLACYAGEATTPLIDWQDEAGVVPHGAGFRYFGVNWQAPDLFSKGVQLTSIYAQDGLDA